MSKREPITLQLLACQLKIPNTADVVKRDLHLQETAAKIRQKLSQKPVDLVVLPELSSVDYARDTFDQLHALAETEAAGLERHGEPMPQLVLLHLAFGRSQCGAARSQH